VAFLLVTWICAQAAWADGQLDPSFGNGGRVELGLANGSGEEGAASVLPIGGGRFVAVGAGEGKGIWVTQHLANGSLDDGFGSGGGAYFPQSSYSFASAAVREPDGSIVIAGGERNSEFDTILARLTPQGALDPSFGNDPPNPPGDGISVYDLGGDDIANGVVIDSTGRIVITGRTGPSGAHDVLLARFNSDGSLDQTFGGPTGVHTNLGGDDQGRAVAMQGSRIIVLATSGTSAYVLGYRPDGTLDLAFGGGDGIAPVSFPSGTESSALLVQPDGRILVAGNVSNRELVARLMPDGSPDTSFGSGGMTSFELPAGEEFFVNALAQSDDGKIIAAATIYAPKHSQVGLLRMLPNGQPDPAWGTNGILAIPTPPETSDSAFALAVEPDRRILIGGATLSKGNSNRLLMRVLGDTTPPDTAITQAPRAKTRSPLRSATLAFEAVGDAHTTFECELSFSRAKRHRHRHHHHHGRPHRRMKASIAGFAPCSSPVVYKALRGVGLYTFAVRAIDPAGNVDPTPAAATFRVLAKRRHHHRRSSISK
jgi:uncharacterized delta-60 repeat protein